MNLLDKIQQKDKIQQLVDDKFIFGNIKYALIKPEKEKYDYIIGVSTDDGEYIFMPYHKTSVINEEKIQYKKEYRNLFDECVEGYILLMLEKGYTLFIMSMYTHYLMWNFIDYFIYEVTHLTIGLNSYLSYCKENGITKNLIENETFTMVADVIGILIEDVVDGCTVALSEYIDDKRIVLGYKFDIDPLTYIPCPIYRVMTVDRNSLKIIRDDYHENIKNAYDDYMSRFMTCSIRYYLSLDDRNRALIEKLNKELQEGTENHHD